MFSINQTTLLQMSQRCHRLLCLLSLSSLLLFSTACREGVTGGSVKKDFAGIDTITVLSPTSVKISWTTNKRYSEYRVYSTEQKEALWTGIFDYAVIENLQPNREYLFKVVGTGESGSAGSEKAVSARTWPRFLGINSLETDTDGNHILSWDYPYEVQSFQVFVKQWEDPTSTNTSAWTEVSLSSNDQEVKFKGLASATRYHYLVHAVYREGEIERPTQVFTKTTGASFPSPQISLSPISIGQLPFATINPIVNDLYKNANYTSRAYRNGSPISDPLIGKGILVFSESANLSLGKIDNVSISVTYNDGTKAETVVQDNLSTYMKGISTTVELPPQDFSSAVGKGHLGKSMASGDFNCDGHSDLAIGIPDASIATYGVKTQGAGAIYIYYSERLTDGTYRLNTTGTPQLAPSRPGIDPQVITFDDLNYAAAFGASMASAGNLNGDKLAQYDCEDLVVGAPGAYINPSNYATAKGVAFVFFGGKNGLKSASHIGDLQDNVETCNGLLEDSTCGAVRLWSDYRLWPESVLSAPYAYSSSPYYYRNERFGTAVSFIGDFNADGYDDLAIGAPQAYFDGYEYLYTIPESVPEVGYVAIFFGSRYGIGQETPEALGIPSATDAKFRFLKIYPPTPQSYMHFGASIHGGADVDGGYRVRDSDGTLHGGGDMVVGAPGFRYENPFSVALNMNSSNSGPDNDRSVKPAKGGWCRASSCTSAEYSTSTNHYGVSQNNAAVSTGIAFLYFGRTFGHTTGPNLTQKEIPSRKDFWSCGKRDMPTRSQHYSCLVNNQRVRTLFPRNNKSRGFGKAVALAGNRNRYDSTNTPLANFQDPNQDGFAEVLIAADQGDSSINTTTGVIWQFFGNPLTLVDRYEGESFYDLYADGDPTHDWLDANPQCSDFSTDSETKKRTCAPTLLRTNSIPTGARLGYSAEGIDVSDMTGDGVLDLIVGAPFDSTKGSGSGAVYIFTSTPGMGLTANYKKLYSNAGDSDDNLGWALAVGNFDGDFSPGGRPNQDVAVGAPTDEQDHPAGGSGQIFMSNGFALPAIKSESEIKLYDRLSAPQGLGFANTRIVGDINGDGRDDAVARLTRYESNGAETYDLVVFFGSDQGLVTSTFCQSFPEKVFKTGQENLAECAPSSSHTPGITLSGVALPQLIVHPNGQPNGWAQYIYAAGDVNKDGYAEVLLYDGSSHQLVLYFGTSGGLQSVTRPMWAPARNDPQIVTQAIPLSSAPYLIESISHRNPVQHGDLNGDGHSDLVLGWPDAASPRVNKGSALLPNTNHDPTSTIKAGDGWLCTGSPDPGTLAGCESGRGIHQHGIVYILYGSSRGIQTPSLNGTHTPGTDISLGNPSTLMDAYGSEAPGATKPCSGSDPNVCLSGYLQNPVVANLDYGWGKLDHRFGASLTVMDIDKDGYDDLLVGAPGYEDLVCWDQPTDPRDYGRVYVFRGSQYGLLANDKTRYYPSYQATHSCPLMDAFGGDEALATATSGGTVLRALQPQLVSNGVAANNTQRQFGYRLSSAGDLNKDGYEDLVITTPQESPPNLSQAGMAYVYYGPICGADNDGTLTTIVQQANNLNKHLLSTDPSLAGITYGQDCQRPAGLKPTVQKFYVADAVAGASFGYQVIGTRMGQVDVNRDGYSDVILGTGYWDDLASGAVNLGRGVFFFGGPAGLFTEEYPSSSMVVLETGQVRPYALLPVDVDSDRYYFLRNVSYGDINGDKTLDLMITSPDHDGTTTKKGIDIGAFFLFY